MEIYNINKSVVPDLVTYPRSGLHFFATAFTDATGIQINSGHDITASSKDIITIVRNPADCFASLRSMDKKRGENYVQSDENYLNQYKEIYSWLITNAKFVIDFDTMEDNINLIVENICKVYGIEVIRTIFPKEILSNLAKNNGMLDDYVIDSSKRLSTYQENKDYWKDKNLKTQIYLYKRLKERSIPV